MLLHPAIFREYDIRGTVPVTLNEETAYAIGAAFGAHLAETGAPAGRVCVGYDGRLSSPALTAALAEGLAESGHTVLDIGIGPTPQLYFSVYALKADAGIMVTGSHNPPDQNGFKFMLGQKPFFGEDIRRLKERIAIPSFPLRQKAGKGAVPKTSPPPQRSSREYIASRYVDTLADAYNGSRPLRVAWDAGNGAAGEAMAALTARLPGTHLLLNEAIDGTFPAHHPDPTEPKNLAQLIEAVRAEKCDAGIAFDGDGDRIGVVDDRGEILWGDQLLALLAIDVLAARPGATVIADVKASAALFSEIKRLGGTPLMWKTGHSHIKAKMAETQAPLAGEMSGHIFFADRYYGYDDGLYAAVRLLSWLSRQPEKLSVLRGALPRTVSTPEIRFPCAEERKFTVIEEVRARLRGESADMNEVDGVRVNTSQGWWLLRASNTQAVLVARAESQSTEGLETLKKQLKQQLAESGVTLPSFP